MSETVTQLNARFFANTGQTSSYGAFSEPVSCIGDEKLSFFLLRTLWSYFTDLCFHVLQKVWLYWNNGWAIFSMLVLGHKHYFNPILAGCRLVVVHSCIVQRSRPCSRVYGQTCNKHVSSDSKLMLGKFLAQAGLFDDLFTLCYQLALS